MMGAMKAAMMTVVYFGKMEMILVIKVVKLKTK
jgi:hypothetical protein